MKFFDLPPLDPASLVGYREDKQAWKRFERRFRLPSIVGVLLFFGAPVAHMMNKLSDGRVGGLMALGLIIIAVSLLWAFKTAPISASGRPMKKYWSSAPKPGNAEVIYVCEESKTYFVRVWLLPSRD